MNKKVLLIGCLVLVLLLGTGCAAAPTSIEATSSPAVSPSNTAITMNNEKLNTTLNVVPKFGQCYFIPERDDIGTWYFINPEGEEFTIAQMKEKCPPSFGADADQNGGLWLYNIDSYLDNWAVICKFADGATTEKGVIQIDYDLPAEAPMTHPM